MIEIGIDTQACHQGMTGLGVYTSNLISAIQAIDRKSFEFHFLHRHKKGDLSTLQRLLWENFQLPQQARRQHLDLLHIPAFAPPMYRTYKKLVVTVHDLIGMAFPNQRGWVSRMYWSKWLPAAIRNADLIIAVSEHTKNDIVRLLRIPESKIRVIYSSGHEGFGLRKDQGEFETVKNKLELTGPYFLSVGTLEPRKNLKYTLDAFSRFVAASPDTHHQLVLVGSLDFAHGTFAAELKMNYSSIAKRLLFTGYVDHETLNLLYSNSTAFLFPSLYEGFGIPVLEAMASGTPVVTSKLTSLPEVAGEAALYVDGFDASQLADHLTTLSQNNLIREELIQRGLRRIQDFSWKQCAENTLQVYQEVLDL